MARGGVPVRLAASAEGDVAPERHHHCSEELASCPSGPIARDRDASGSRQPVTSVDRISDIGQPACGALASTSAAARAPLRNAPSIVPQNSAAVCSPARWIRPDGAAISTIVPRRPPGRMTRVRAVAVRIVRPAREHCVLAQGQLGTQLLQSSAPEMPCRVRPRASRSRGARPRTRRRSSPARRPAHEPSRSRRPCRGPARRRGRRLVERHVQLRRGAPLQPLVARALAQGREQAVAHDGQRHRKHHPRVLLAGSRTGERDRIARCRIDSTSRPRRTRSPSSAAIASARASLPSLEPRGRLSVAAPPARSSALESHAAETWESSTVYVPSSRSRSARRARASSGARASASAAEVCAASEPSASTVAASTRSASSRSVGSILPPDRTSRAANANPCWNDPQAVFGRATAEMRRTRPR